MGGKVASVSRVFSAVELVICSIAKIPHTFRTTYSCLDKLSRNDATLPNVSYIALPGVSVSWRDCDLQLSKLVKTVPNQYFAVKVLG